MIFLTCCLDGFLDRRNSLRVEAVAMKQKDQEVILGITVALLAVRMSKVSP